MKPCGSYYDDEDMHDSSLETSDSSDNSFNLNDIKNDPDACQGCHQNITNQYLLRVNEYSWHISCLRCCICQMSLDRQSSCYMKGGSVYCGIDYAREFGTKCARCLRGIHSTDWVRRAKNHVYHLACFACDSCKRQLSTGEEYALEDNRLLCKSHYVEMIEGGDDRDSDGSRKTKAKRVRTTFTDEQVSVLQANFQLESNPDGQDLERIAQITGLSKRVTQVWFQNSRARQKKHQQVSPSDSLIDSHLKYTPSYESTGELTSPGSMGSSPPSHSRGYPPSPPMWRSDCHSADGLSFSD